MQVVNPFNRVPETEESLAFACRCMCSTGSADKLNEGRTDGDYCGCQCGSGTVNNNANDVSAYNIGNGHYQ